MNSEEMDLDTFGIRNSWKRAGNRGDLKKDMKDVKARIGL